MNAKLLGTMVASLTQKLTFATELCGNHEAAVAYVRNESTAGPKAWAISLRILALVEGGMDVAAAFDSVLGEGSYATLAGEVYDALKA